MINSSFLLKLNLGASISVCIGFVVDVKHIFVSFDRFDFGNKDGPDINQKKNSLILEA